MAESDYCNSPESEPKRPNETVDELPPLTAVEEKAILRPIDLCLLPLMFVSYLLQYLDKTAMSYTSILGLLPGTHMNTEQYSWASSAFYFGYMVASYPVSIGFVKFPIGKYLSIMMIIWAIILTCHAAASSFAGITTLRVLLGVFESAISPGFTIVVGMWYTPSEHALRSCIWFAGNGVASIFGGVLSYAIGHVHNRLGPWQWVFIIFGIITLVWSIFQFFALPDSPLNAKFLSPSQRGPAYRRAQACQQTYRSREWKKDQFIEALIDPKTWFLFTYNFLVSLPNGGITNFSSLVIASFGFDTFNTLLYTIPMAAVALVFLLLSAFTCNRFRGLRCYWMIITLLISLIGILLMRQLPVEKKWGRLVGVWLVTVFGAGFPLSLSLVSSNFAGFTKKTTVTAILFIGYCVGNIAGPQLFKKNQAPHYYSAFAAILACFCIAVLDVALLRAYMVWENKRRDRNQGRVIEPETKEAEDSEGSTARRQVGDMSDWQNESFRFCL
ncbi:major facilitator superfamily domain-containing protein [Aspergillus pseudonomiae]|uniref:Major facilitator superfamily domain-containing protein n=1 Tax=Aspergillus pseudonomiae TaxID=1506151 RepID=A0A5N7DT72_9EURO|nr:major facilitator superfamily domain-containing protein [Aspergillus pseudonomiae]KAE8408698.1 major facilitator superfamily domain-containing protein [Aspergillus pseudonomiae]